MSRRRRNGDVPVGLSGAIDELSVLLVCGSGGVGKTSVAAAIAVAQAERGRRVCVLTIDPARRLADAMGLSRLDDAERSVDLPGSMRGTGSLHALQLDPGRAFDRLVSETAPDAASRKRIVDNRIYQHLSRSTSGMQEYMALERLYELDRSDRYDLIVVDTPPAAHARDLLDSPQRMLEFLNGRSLRWFLRPSMKASRFGLKAIGGASGAVIGLLQRVTGAELLRDTVEFFEAFEGMYDAFTERIQIVERMFSDERTGFLVVTSPEREGIDDAEGLWQVVIDRNFTFVGSIVNRIEPSGATGDLTHAELAAVDGIDGDLAARICAAARDHELLVRRDAKRVSQLAEVTAGASLTTVPRIDDLPADLTGVATLAGFVGAG